ncbi:MAG TPA: von Willebrand factor type A domain-containing protein [Streptosporangiaceae bacterium]|nr:von Willebrand factor type A domain-containing protein [Streptosporangiaceae bacterium]
MRIMLAASALAVALAVTGCSSGSQRDSTASGGSGGAPRQAVPGKGAPGPGLAAPPEGAEEGRDDQAGTATSYLSTFALDVDTASYGFARRALTEGRLPDPGTVRPEEFVNQFRQGYPEPDGNGFSITTDGGRLAAADGDDGGDGGDVRMLRVGLQTRAASAGGRRDANLTFVIDTSGSMAEPGRLDLVKDALHTLVGRLRPSDKVAIVAYESDARVVRPMTSAADRREINDAIDGLRPGSSTNLGAGMVLGYREARRNFRAGVTNRVILASDGLANTGETDSAAILRKVSDEAGRGVSLLCVGVGSDYGDALMEQLADHGDGRAVYVSERAKAREIFVRDLPATLELRARDAKAQVAFDAGQVESFRLIGYDDRGLRAEDFRDDTVDGGEIGPGHSVTALYAVRLRPGAAGHVGDVMVRWQDPDTRRPQENGRTITVGDLAPDLWSAGGTRLRIDAAAAYFAELLRDGDTRRGGPARSPYVRPASGPFVTHGRVPGEPWTDLGQLAGYVDALSRTAEDAEVSELADLIHRARNF